MVRLAIRRELRVECALIFVALLLIAQLVLFTQLWQPAGVIALTILAVSGTSGRRWYGRRMLIRRVS